MKIFKVSLEPLDWFFFGGEKTFDNSITQSYIARSNIFPQQTALLGMIRYQLLKQKGLLFKDNKINEIEKVSALIGEDSFKMGIDKQTFGVIDSLSPIYIEKRIIPLGEVYSFFPIPLTQNCNITFEDNIKVYLNGYIKSSLICDNNTFNPKYYSNNTIFQDKEGDKLEIDQIFIKKEQIGITKNTDSYSSKTNDEGFYKREIVKFRNNSVQAFNYSFYISFNNDLEELKSDYVFLGAERSCFKMTVQQVDKTNDLSLRQIFMRLIPQWENGQNNKIKVNQIVLLSPTFIKDMNKLNKLCIFHWSYQMAFRNITRTVGGKLNSGDVTYHREGICYNMLCPGSILFFKEQDRSDIEQLLNDIHLQDIGYNYYKSMS